MENFHFDFVLEPKKFQVVLTTNITPSFSQCWHLNLTAVWVWSLSADSWNNALILAVKTEKWKTKI
jgi:hypothetical protein